MLSSHLVEADDVADDVSDLKSLQQLNIHAVLVSLGKPIKVP